MNVFLQNFVHNHPILIVSSWVIFLALVFNLIISYLNGCFSKKKGCSEQDLIDAARYRFFRDFILPQQSFKGSSSDFDNAIDEEMGLKK